MERRRTRRRHDDRRRTKRPPATRGETAVCLCSGRRSHRDRRRTGDATTDVDADTNIRDRANSVSTAPITVSTAPLDIIVAPAPTTSTAPVDVPTGDPTVRRPTRPARRYAPLIKKLRTTVLVPQPIIRTPTQIEEARRRTRICSVNHVAVRTVDFTKTTEQLTHELAQTHALNSTEQRQYLKEMSIMSVGQKALVRKIRSGCGLKCRTDEDHCRYLDWMEDEFLALLAHASDSDEQ